MGNNIYRCRRNVNICASVRVNMHTCLCRRHRPSCVLSVAPRFWHQTQTADRRSTMPSLRIMAAKPDSALPLGLPLPPSVRPLAGPHLAADAEVPKPLSNRNRGVPRLIDRTYNTGKLSGEQCRGATILAGWRRKGKRNRAIVFRLTLK